MNIVWALERIRRLAKQPVILECSTNPEEWICSVGIHHRGQWLESHRIVGSDVKDVVLRMYEYAANEYEDKMTGLPKTKLTDL